MSTILELAMYFAVAAFSIFSASSVASFGLTPLSAGALIVCVGGAAFSLYLLLMRGSK